jgi:transcriptional regulator with XRE-family HTH domain
MARNMAEDTFGELSGIARSDLGEFLRILRRRLDEHVTALGPFKRLPSKIGRRITQEEIAEVVGVSRGWYRMLEANGASRTTPRLLVRISNALMLSGVEQAHLFHLAFPELAIPETGCSLCAPSLSTNRR